MNCNQWICKQFNQLSTDELYDLLKLRINIFVVEQSCPYPELDDYDRTNDTYHLMGFGQHTLICCARILAPGTSYPEVSIGRFAVAEPYRRQGVGRALINQCLIHIHGHWPDNNIRISAQKYLYGFYAEFGFIQTSKPYLEDGIPHIEMLKTTVHNHANNNHS